MHTACRPSPRRRRIMQATRLALFALLALLLPLAAHAAEDTNRQGKVKGIEHFDLPAWFKDSFLDIEDDAAEAGENGRHLLAFFHLENCPYCAKMLKDSFAEATDNAPFIQDNFDAMHIDIRGLREVTYQGEEMNERQFARRIGVQYTPTLLFFEASGQAVLTVNGYRSPKALRRALQYVKDGVYRRMSLTEYAQKNAAGGTYALRPHPDFQSLQDLSAVQGPLMLILEDATCDECAWVHDNILHQPDVREQLQQLTAVRLDANATTPLTTPGGKQISAAQFARDLNLSYRPGVVFYEDGKEIFRVTGLLNHYHFREAVRYVVLGHRRAYPRFGAYLRERRQELLAAGEDVDYSI